MRLKNRQSEIVKILSRENTYVTVNTIATELNVSARTIHNDLNEMSLPSSPYVIERKQGLGVRIVWLESATVSNLDVTETHNRMIAIFQKLLFDQTVVTIQSLADTYYVSATSIAQDLSIIRDTYLNEATVILVSDVHGTRFEGNEQQIQKTMLIFNDMLMERHHEPLSEYTILYPYYGRELVDTCIKIVQSLESYNLYSVAKHYEANVFSVLVVMCYRLSLGKHLPYTHDSLKVDEVMAMKHYLIAKDLLDMLMQKFEFSYETTDVYSLSMYLQANRLEFMVSTTRVDTETESIATRMIQRMSVCVGVDLNDDTDLIHNISVHLYHMHYRMANQIYIRNPLIDLIKEEFRLVFDLTWLVVEGERESMNIDVTEDEIGFLMLHFQSALDKAMKSKKVLVVCHNGVVSSGFIVNRIRRILPPLDIIESTSVDAVNRFDLESVDLIVSTVPLINVSQPVVVVSPLITERDLDAINKVYQHHLVHQEVDETITFKHLKPYLDSSLIFTNQTATSSHEILEHVSKILIEESYVDSEYTASLLEREANGGTEIATGAAVPHGSMDLVHKTVLPIWVNKTPVKWGKYSVRVVIFFTLAKKDLSHAKPILEDIFKCVKSKKFIDTCLVKLDKETLLELLSGGDTLD